VISVKLPQPQFEGQTKGKLNSDISGYVTQFVNEKLASTSTRTRPSCARSSQGESMPRAPGKRPVKLAI